MRASLIGSCGPGRGLGLGLLALVLAPGCTPHDDPPAPTPPSAAEPPAVIQEIEPTPPPPPIVAPALPPLKPTRPLANLQLRWTEDRSQPQPATSSPAALWPLGTRLVAMDGSDAQALGLDGPPVPLIDELRDASVRRAGPLLVVDDGTSFTAYTVDSAEGVDTAEVRWVTPPILDGRSYLHVIGERVLVAVAHRSTQDELAAWALDDGRRQWLREGASADAPGSGFSRIRDLASDGERGYLIGDAGFEAFDLITGQTLWTARSANPSCGFAAAEGLVVLEDPGGHRVLDAELGTEAPKRVGPPTGECTWTGYGVGPGVISGGWLYTFESDPATPHWPTILVAYELASGAEQWRAPDTQVASFAVDHDAVYLVRDDFTLVALDAKTGVPAYDYGFGRDVWIEVQAVGGEAGPLLLADDGYEQQWIFARGPQPTPPEAWEIRAKLVSDGYLAKDRLRGAIVEVGGVRVETDKRGRFVAKGSGRGVVTVVSPMDESVYDPDTWSFVQVETQQVELDGSGTYELGELTAYEGYVE